MNKIKYISHIKKAIQNAVHPKAPADGLFQSTSVIILFFFDTIDKDVDILFIQKADVKGYPWANQMAFPGGHQDKQDTCTQDTALRELSEEMGIIRENVKIIGSLGHFQTINNKNIEAFAGFWNGKDTIRPDTTEISRVFKIPLEYLIDIHKKKDFHIQKPNVMQLAYPFEDVLIWGVTAKMLYHFIECFLLEHRS